MQKKPNLYDLWREFRFFANVSDRKYLEHLDFFIEAKTGRFFRPKEGQRRSISLSSLHGLEEELEAVQKYIFWKRRTPRVKKFTPKVILMAPKSGKKRDKIPTKSPTQTPSQSPVKTTPMTPSSSSTHAKVEVCKSLALPTVALKEFRGRLEELGLGFLFWRWDFSAETLVKEFATVKSDVDLPHRGKPHEWTIAHWRKAFGRSDKDDEGGIVWDTSVARLTMPEGVNPEELFSEKRPEKDKNGYKTRSYKNPFRKQFQTALLCKSILKALKDPTSSLWAPIFSKVFLAVDAGQLGVALSGRLAQSTFKQCPLASLLWNAWVEFFNLFYWRPERENELPTDDICKQILLVLRRRLDVREATVAAGEILSWLQEEDITSHHQLKAKIHVNPQYLSRLNSPMQETLSKVTSAEPVMSSTFQPTDWVTADGVKLNTQWRAAQMYTRLLKGKASEQYERMNRRWQLSWDPHHWDTVWGVADLKLVPFRHRCFIWREISRFKGTSLALPDLIRWAMEGEYKVRLRRCWMLAVTWRVLWAERCALKFQGRRNTVSELKILLMMSEEVYARRKALGPRIVKDFVAVLFPAILVIPDKISEVSRSRRVGVEIGSPKTLLHRSDGSLFAAV
ncbi:hypothetical protein R1sor_019594 [Riccia sorocarpa]|uniref:Uncharacterized protein n=1 Tax=Riccia sorocarpa TaxID=122646 RepID=A0ABD3IFN4_9MARC